MRLESTLLGLLCGAFLYLAVLAATGLASSPSFKIFTTENGLANDSINKITRDSRGFLWLCTDEGLSRFDGTRFTNFTQEHGLPYRRVTDFLELQDGTYLVGTSRGLVIFDPKGKPYRWNVLEKRLEADGPEPPMFRTFTPPDDDWHTHNIFSLVQTPDGTIWVGTEVNLYSVAKIGGELIFTKVELGESMKMNFVGLLSDSRGGLIAATSGGLYRLFNGNFRKFSDVGGDDIIEDRKGTVWLGSGGTHDGLRGFEFDGDDLKLTRQYTKNDGLLDDIHLRTLTIMSDGRIFIGGDTVGLAEFRPDATAGESRFRTLSHDNIQALGEDSAGNLWIGSQSKGAWQMSPGGFIRFDESDGIDPSADIGSIHTNREGELFLAVQPNKLFHLTPNGKFENILPANQPKRSWGWNFLDLQAADGEWWIPSVSGLYRYPSVNKPADLAHAIPKRVYSKSEGIWNDAIFTIFEDSRGDIWMTSEALSRWDSRTDKIFSYSVADGLPEKNGAVSFAEDTHGNVWLGHYFGKIVRYRNGKFETFSAESGLPESRLEDLLVDQKGRLWIASAGYGIFRVDDTNAESPVFTSISTRQGLSSNQILCLAQDRFGSVYAGTGHGVNRIDQEDIIRTFTQSDGLPGNYVTRCADDIKGNLWFVAQNVLVRFTPGVEANLAPPRVYIDRVSVNGVSERNSVLGETEIVLPDLSSAQTQIAVDYFALTFGSGENIRYQYRLDDQEWSRPAKQQSVDLNLSVGNHNFEVRAIRPDGLTSERTATASINILPPIWRRWWFVAICLIAVGGLLVTFYKYRVANLRRINAALTEAKLAEQTLRKSREDRLAELEHVRTRIATDLHDDIGASLTQIAILSEVARQKQAAHGKNGSDSEQLTMIYGISNQLVSTMSDIVWAINPHKDKLHDLTLRMRRFASDVLSAKEIDFEFVAPENIEEFPLNANLRREVFLIFKESVNNIVKHADATQVEIEMRLDQRELFLSIADNGRGFESDPAQNGESANLFADYRGGNGLTSIRRRAAEMGGEVDITSTLNRGTEIILRLPVAIQTDSDLTQESI